MFLYIESYVTPNSRIIFFSTKAFIDFFCKLGDSIFFFLYYLICNLVKSHVIFQNNTCKSRKRYFNQIMKHTGWSKKVYDRVCSLHLIKHKFFFVIFLSVYTQFVLSKLFFFHAADMYLKISKT